jgi:hypothetical protein
MPDPIHFWKFNKQCAVSLAWAEDYARKITTGEISPVNVDGARWHLNRGWAFDIGRKPYLIEAADGSIYRRWARSVGELRKALYLKRSERVIADPFKTR